jgi:hypothetical protein
MAIRASTATAKTADARFFLRLVRADDGAHALKEPMGKFLEFLRVFFERDCLVAGDSMNRYRGRGHVVLPP